VAFAAFAGLECFDAMLVQQHHGPPNAGMKFSD
jgi:hypothetical protein